MRRLFDKLDGAAARFNELTGAGETKTKSVFVSPNTNARALSRAASRDHASGLREENPQKEGTLSV